MMRRRALCAALAGSALLGMGTAAPYGVTALSGPGFRQKMIGAGYFGMHFHRLGRQPGEPAPTAWPEHAVVGTVRLWDSGTRWGDVAPIPGRWNFDGAFGDDAGVSGSVEYG